MTWLTSKRVALVCQHQLSFLLCYIWPVWLEIAYSRPFWGVLGDMTGFPWDWVPAQRVEKLQCWGTRGSKKFKIGLSVLTQYRRVTDTQPATQPSFHSKYRASKRRTGKKPSLCLPFNLIRKSTFIHSHSTSSNPISAGSASKGFVRAITPLAQNRANHWALLLANFISTTCAHSDVDYDIQATVLTRPIVKHHMLYATIFVEK